MKSVFNLSLVLPETVEVYKLAKGEIGSTVLLPVEELRVNDSIILNSADTRHINHPRKTTTLRGVMGRIEQIELEEVGTYDISPIGVPNPDSGWLTSNSCLMMYEYKHRHMSLEALSNSIVDMANLSRSTYLETLQKRHSGYVLKQQRVKITPYDRETAISYTLKLNMVDDRRTETSRYGVSPESSSMIMLEGKPLNNLDFLNSDHAEYL